MPDKDINGDSGILFEEGVDDSTLVIAFSGGFNLLMMNPYDFMSITNLQQYHRIFFQDKYNLWYQNGVNSNLTSFRQLCHFISTMARTLNVERLLVIGTSSGGHAALLAGHRLKADAVHVFGPQTNVGLGFLREESIRSIKARRRKVRLLYRKQWLNWRNFDLKKALRRYNGKTQYYIHYAIDNPRDRERALYLEQTPGVRLFSYPYKTHGIVSRISKRGMLEQLFRSDNVYNPQSLYSEFYGDTPTDADVAVSRLPTPAGIAEIVQAVTVSSPELTSIVTSTDLPAQLALDSVACMEIIVKLENAFGVHVAMDAIEMADLKTVDALLQLVKRSEKS